MSVTYNQDGVQGHRHLLPGYFTPSSGIPGSVTDGLEIMKSVMSCWGLGVMCETDLDKPESLFGRLSVILSFKEPRKHVFRFQPCLDFLSPDGCQK